MRHKDLVLCRSPAPETIELLVVIDGKESLVKLDPLAAARLGQELLKHALNAPVFCALSS